MPEIKKVIISTITPGYMFSLNATINANMYYGTNADVHILYTHTEQEYIDKFKDRFPFEVKWIPMRSITEIPVSYHNAKYIYAKSMKDKYDVVCLVDGDLFVCCNLNEWLERAVKEDILFSATHVWSGGSFDETDFKNPENINDRGVCKLADFPVMVNPNTDRAQKMFDYWFRQANDSLEGINSEYSHPLIAFNRSVAKFYDLNSVVPLDGDQWVCDKNYWEYAYVEGLLHNGKKALFNNAGRVYAIHNRWWKEGRANAEWRAHIGITSGHIFDNLVRGEKNMNVIKSFMEFMNDLVPETRCDHYIHGPISRKDIEK